MRPIKAHFLRYATLAFCMFVSMAISYGQRTIQGTITDSNSGEALIGATVVVGSTGVGAATDIDGAYSIQAETGDVLTFSYVGYADMTMTVGASDVIDVTMQEGEILDEVVVVGYGTQKKSLLTGAGLNVKGEEIAALNTGTAMEALQGIAPGVSITRNSGAPGASTRVVVRGLGTIGNSNPLFVVDGVRVGNIDYLNPSDIEAIDVLKDAASTAIYGSSAANGVVLVTTVKGRKNAPARISYDAYYGVQNIAKKIDPLNAQEYMFIQDEARINDALAPWDWESRLQNNAWLNGRVSGLGTQLGQDVWSQLQNGWAGTNWIDEIETGDAPMQSHSLNITGGSDALTYAIGASYFDQDGILGGNIINSGFRRLTAKINTEMVLKRNDSHNIITIGENFTYNNSETRNVRNDNIYWNDLYSATITNPLMPAYWAPSLENNIDPFGFTPTLDGWATGHVNPVANMFYLGNFNEGRGNSLVGNVYAEIEPIKDLVLRSSFGMNTWFGHGRSMTHTRGLGILSIQDIDGVNQSSYLGGNQTFSTTLSYKRGFNKGHNVNALVGTELYQDIRNNNLSANRTGLIFPNNFNTAYIANTNSPASIADIGNFGADWAAGGGAILSYIGRVQYDFQEKYLFTATLRADGSSNFAENNRWGYFPSLSAGWVLSKEDFAKSISALDFAKIRVSWGQNGNQAIPNFLYSSNIAYAFPGYFFGDTKPVSGATAFPERVANPDIKWETSEQFNIGLDARFFDSKFWATVDYYKKTTKDWLVEAPALGTSGALPPFINGGDIENSGLEFSLGLDDAAGDFNYRVTLTGAFNKNRVTRIANSDGIIQGPGNVLAENTAHVSRVEVDMPIGFFYGYQTDGILQNTAEVNAYTNADGAPYFADQRAGDVRFVDQNGDGVIDIQDKVMLGDPNPDFEGGLQLKLEYKGIYLNTTLTGKFGMQVMQSYRSFTNFETNYTSEIFNRWHGEGTSDLLPRLSSNPHRNTTFISDIYMKDADFVRINNLTIGYNFDKLIRNVNAISDLQIYVTVNNLHTFTKYNGWDPEVRYGGSAGWASGIDLGLYPLARTVMIGVNAGF